MTAPLASLTASWTSGATVYSAIKMNVADSGHDPASKLLDLQIGGTSYFSVDPVGATKIANGTLTANDPALDISQTWNNAAVAFTGFKFNVAPTAFSTTFGASKLFDFQVGGNSFMWAGSDGNVVINQQTGAIYTGLLAVQYQGVNQFLVQVGGITAPHNISFGDGGHTSLINVDAGNASIWCPAFLVVAFGDSGLNANGWIQWGGLKRVTTDVNFNNTTTLALVTGLQVALQANRTYEIEVDLSFTCTAAQGIRAALVASGGLTASNVIYDGWIMDSGANGVKGNAQATALGTVVANAPLTGTAGHLFIRGMITVGVAGTLQVHAAQSVAAANNTTVKQGSNIVAYDMP